MADVLDFETTDVYKLQAMLPAIAMINGKTIDQIKISSCKIDNFLENRKLFIFSIGKDCQDFKKLPVDISLNTMYSMIVDWYESTEIKLKNYEEKCVRMWVDDQFINFLIKPQI